MTSELEKVEKDIRDIEIALGMLEKKYHRLREKKKFFEMMPP